MNTTKLYTEEQVREILKSTHIHTDNDVDMILPQFTPIELPSDEEIEEWLFHQSNECADEYKDALEYAFGYKDAFKWMRDKILNK